MFRVFLNLLFPRTCAVCRRELPDRDVCDSCVENIPVFGWMFCAQCNRRLPDMFPCRRHRTPLAGIGVAADYGRKDVRALIHTYKYRGRHALAAPLAELLIRHARAGLAAHLAASGALVVPIPLTRRREYARGFNQAALIAQRLAGHFGLPYRPDALERHIERPPQVKMRDAAARRENIRGVFRTTGDQNLLRGRTILLIDDVASSGATLIEAGRTLKAAGAKTVWAIVIARGQ